MSDSRQRLVETMNAGLNLAQKVLAELERRGADLSKMSHEELTAYNAELNGCNRALAVLAKEFRSLNKSGIAW